MIRRPLNFIFLFSCFWLGAIGQNHSNEDSLYRIASNPRNSHVQRMQSYVRLINAVFLDSVKTKKIIDEADRYASIRPPDSLYFDLLERKYRFANQQGKNVEALHYLQECINLADRIHDTSRMAFGYRLKGDFYKEKGIMDRAIEYEKTYLSLCRQLKDTGRIMDSHYLMGWYQFNSGDYKNSLENFKKAFSILKRRKIKGSLFNEYCGWVANAYLANKIIDSAVVYRRIALQTSLNDRDSMMITDSWRYLAQIFMRNKQYDSAIYYLKKPLTWYRSQGWTERHGIVNLQLANCFNNTGEYKRAAALLDTLLDPNKNFYKIVYLRQVAYESGSNIYEKAGDLKKAFFCLKRAYVIKDSLQKANEENHVIEAGLKYDFDLIQEKDRMTQEKKEAVFLEQQARERQIKWFVFIGMILCAMIAILAYRGYLQKKKGNLVLTEQKAIIEEKNREIIDSMNYAKHLQNAILPSLEYVRKFLPEFCLLYKPKDIIAGDFYFFERINGWMFIAAADCTGHGIPGAMVSVVCSNALTSAIREFGLTDPGEILGKTRELVVSTFEKSGADVKDGMDISFLAIREKDKKMFWAGANNPLWIVRKDADEADTRTIELKADKQPVGFTFNPKPFQTHVVDYKKGDTLYMITDGFADQFGGPKGKKFKYKQLQKVIIEFNDASLAEQCVHLDAAFEEWKGDMEQIDDVCIIGLRV